MCLRVVLLFLIVLPELLYASADTVRISASNEVTDIREFAEFYLDPASKLSPEEIFARYHRGDFFRVTHESANFSGEPGTIWFRFVLKSEPGEDIAMRIPNVLIENLHIFICKDDSVLEHKKTGFGNPFHPRDFIASDYIISLSKSQTPMPLVIYGSLAASTKPPMILMIHVGTEKRILADSRTSELISISVVGALFVMFLYNLCLALMIADRLYFHYCFYICSSIVVILWLNGYLFEWMWPNAPARNIPPWPMGTFILGQLIFANKLLNVRQVLPIFFRFSILIYAGAFLIIASPLLPLESISIVIALICIILPAYFLAVSFRLCMDQVQMAYIFLLGWLPILFVTILNGLMLFDQLEYNLFLDLHAVELSLTWELIVFSLALGFRYNIMRSEKLHAQAATFKIITEQKSTLRKLVIEQTEEILAQNDQLLRNQEEIKLQNERLETQNKAYERLKEMILRQNHELETSVQRRTLQLAQSNEELKKHVHQLEQFSFIAAHNLRAPVARILGLVNILDYTNPNNTENTGILKKIVASARDLDIIVHDLGAILEAQKNKIDKTECVDMSQLIEKIIHRHKPDIDGAGIIIETSLGASCITGVPAYLDSIMSNLISNSIKYRADHRKPIILIATEENISGATIIVHDNGIGFDSRLFNHKIFEPFQRFHTHTDGKGLGMFLVKTHVIAMKGTIALTSEPDVGTHVIITLPKV